ncbi:AsmA-like C-terminal region-containing protein, partial [Marinobacter alexandrii]
GLEVSTDASSKIWVRSDLQGVAVDWPQPLAKSAEESAPLEAFIDPQAPGGLAVSGTWENRASFDVLWKPSGLEVSLGHLYLGRHTLNDIQIEALDLGDRWVVTTHSERAVGRVAVPDDGSTVMADFEVVRLTRDERAEQEEQELLTFEEQLQAFRALDMGEWPDVNATIADLRLDDETLGTWSFKLRPEPYRLAVERIQGRLKSLTLVGDMSWSIIDDREKSRFAGSVTGGKVADLNSLFGTEIPLTNETTNIELDLDWPGRPDEIALTDMNGSVSLRLDEGIILEQNNTAQLFRVFNLLNADTLWRRLKLDFSDLYERGVAFDAISGRAQLLDGRVNMDPELQVVGPSGAFKLSGSTDIATETLDMRLVVVLPLTQNLPLAALLMGAGAPIGGALFVLDKILGDPLSKLTSASYGVTGTWDDPKVDLRRVFDNGE